MIDISTWLPPILGVGALQGGMLTLLLLFFRKGNRKALLMLSILVFVYSGTIFSSFMVFGDYYKLWPHAVLICYPFERLIGPAFFFFAVFLVRPSRSLRWFDLFHLLPVAYIFSQMWPFYVLPLDGKVGAIASLWSLAHRLTPSNLFMELALHVLTASYVVATILFLDQSLKQYKEITSNTLLDFIEWLKKLSWAFLCFLIISFLGVVISFFADLAASRIEVVTHLMITILIHFMAFITIQQPDKIFFKTNEDTLKTIDNKPRPSETLEPLMALMAKEKPYLDPNLKVHNLAIMLDTSPHKLSRLINREKGQNFYDFINYHRVEEFKRRVCSQKYDQLTLLGIALDVGFNSKSSFNRIFKKLMGITPSEYMKKKEVPTSNFETNVD